MAKFVGRLPDKFANPSFHQAGQTERQLAVAEVKLKRDEAREARQRRKMLNQAGDLGIDSGVVTNPALPRLPDEFVEPIIEQIRQKIQIGNFEALHGLIDTLTERAQLHELQSSPLAKRPLYVRLATYLTECPHPDTGHEEFPVRVANAIESVCPATLGAILEHWPMGFADIPNFGPGGAAVVGKTLVAAGLLTVAKFDEGMVEFKLAHDYKPPKRA